MGVLRAIVSAFLFLGYLWVLFDGVSANQAKWTMVKVTVAAQSSGSSEFSRPNGKDWLNVSKRRVPNGPDPIHNRRVGNTRQPPNRA